MALPPTAAPTDAPPPDMGAAAAPDADAATEDTEGGADDSGWTVCCTILKNDSTGQFKLISGDEPEPEEGGDMASAEGQVFDSGPQLLRAVMHEIESDSGAERAFTSATKNGSSAPPMKGPSGSMPPEGM